MSVVCFRARHVTGFAGQRFSDGCIVVIDGRIVDIGPTKRVNPSRVDHEIDGVLMPGLVNRHTHLELTNVPRCPAPASFQEWLTWLAPAIRGDAETFAQRRADAVREGIAQSVRFGVTEVWDISQNVEIVRPILADAPIRSISFGECLGIGERRERFDRLLEKAIDTTHCNERMSIGISPHAPYTVDERGYQLAISTAADLGLPVMTHLAETSDESRFLLDHGGAFGALYAQLGIDPGAPPRFAGSPVQWLATLARGVKVHLAHVNYVDADDIALLPHLAASVIWCPRTHAYFGHRPHRWREFFSLDDYPLYIGTDSCASSPNLNIVDDLRLIHAESLEDADWSLCSTPRADRQADLTAFPTRSDHPEIEILETPDILPSAVFVAGERVSV